MTTHVNAASALPPRWSSATIDECFFDIRKGLTTPQNREGRGIAVTRIDTVRNGALDFKRLQYVEGIDAINIERYRYEPGDIVFSNINDMERIGNTALYTGEPNLLLHGMNLLRLRPGHTLIHPPYLYWYMQTRQFRQEVRDRSIPSVNQRVISQALLADIVIPLAPYNEQIRIVGKIEHLIDKVRVCRRRLQEASKVIARLRLSILASACSGRLTAEWREAHPELPPATEQIEQVRDAEFLRYKKMLADTSVYDDTAEPRKFPVLSAAPVPVEEVLENSVPGWSALTLKYLVTEGGLFEGPFGSMLKVSDYTTSGVRVIDPDNVGFLTFNEKPEKYISHEKFAAMTRHGVQTGDLLFSSVVADEVKSCLLPELPVDAMLRMNCFCIRPLPGLVSREYLMIQLCGAVCAGQLRAYAAESGRPTVTMAQLRSILVPVCSAEEQEEIARRVRSLLAGMARLEERSRRIAAYLDTLEAAVLDKAFRGELVSAVPDDEPATLLRERLLAQREQFPVSRTSNRRRKKT